MSILLQPLVLPDASVKEEEYPLFLKGKNWAWQDVFRIKAGITLDFFSYFNLFSKRKWITLTGSRDHYLAINGYGSLKICIIGWNSSTGKKNTLFEQVISMKGEQKISIPSENCEEIISFYIETYSDCFIIDGGWHGSPIQSSVVKAAVIMPAFNRDEIWQNLETISRGLPDGWDIIIINQGDAFNPDNISRYKDSVTFIKNLNFGGSGGFTKGLTEALLSDNGYTHAVFLDDDIRINISVLDRLNRLLTNLRPEFSGYFIAGAMLEMDKPYKQWECGAVWNGLRVKHLFHNLDLSRERNLLKNETILKKYSNEYAAWWFCTMPINNQMLDRLPVPMFLNGDDIEYSYRYSSGLIRLNGIAVWHESFENKDTEIKYYLKIRNTLILNVMTGKPFYKSLFVIIFRSFQNVLQKRFYKNRILKSAVEHFLNGPDFLWETAEYKSLRYWNNQNNSRSIIKILIKLIGNHRFVSSKYLNMSLDFNTWTVKTNLRTGNNAEKI